MRAEPLALLIDAQMHASIGSNIQGPCLLRVPGFVERRLGDYYLYFADHKGSHIRLAYADRIDGPWTIHPGGVLQLDQSHFLTSEPEVDRATVDDMVDRYRAVLGDDKMPDDAEADMVTPHLASPDVIIDEANEEFLMYFHGLDGFATQRTRTASSKDGLAFVAAPDITVDETYLRVFSHAGTRYGIAMPGQMYRQEPESGVFVRGPRLFDPDMRHSGVRVRGDVAEIYWTRVGDTPERILLSRIDVSVDFERWAATAPEVVHEPTETWEGAALALAPSRRGAIDRPVRQLRDPFVFTDLDETSYLLYAVAGESGIGLARLIDAEGHAASSASSIQVSTSD